MVGGVNCDFHRFVVCCLHEVYCGTTIYRANDGARALWLSIVGTLVERSAERMGIGWRVHFQSCNHSSFS